MTREELEERIAECIEAWLTCPHDAHSGIARADNLPNQVKWRCDGCGQIELQEPGHATVVLSGPSFQQAARNVVGAALRPMPASGNTLDELLALLS